MAKVLFAIQTIGLIFILPLFPGFPERLYSTGLVLLLLVAGLPVLVAMCIWRPQDVLRALVDSFSYRRLGSNSETTVRIWKCILEIFPITGFAALLLSCTVIAETFGKAPSDFLPVLITFAWIALGFTLYSILSEVVVRLSSTSKAQPGFALPPEYAGHYQLTKREIEVAELLLRGLTYREIGGRLYVSPSTAKTHVLHIYQKTGATSKSDLVRLIRDYFH